MKTPESSSGLRIARFWNTNANISMPLPATAHAINEPNRPVATPNRAGSENTPAPTMLPTTIAVSVGTLIFVTTAPAPGLTSAAAPEVVVALEPRVGVALVPPVGDRLSWCWVVMRPPRLGGVLGPEAGRPQTTAGVPRIERWWDGAAVGSGSEHARVRGAR